MALKVDNLGTLVTQAFSLLPGVEGIFHESIAEAMDLKPNSVGDYIRRYKLDYALGTTSGTPKLKTERLERLAVFIFATNIEDDDKQSLVEEIKSSMKEEGLEFIYPPPEDRQVPFSKIQALYDQAQVEVVEEPADVNYRELGEYTSKKLEESPFTQTYLGYKLSTAFGDLQPSSATKILVEIMKGNYYGSEKKPIETEIALEKLSLFLFALGFSEDNEQESKILRNLKEKDNKFVYPPTSGNRISYNSIIEGIREVEYRPQLFGRKQ